MDQAADMWESPGAVACALTVAARESARAAARQTHSTEHRRWIADAKVVLEEATVVVAQTLDPPVSIHEIEQSMRNSRSLPAVAELSKRSRELLAGPDPLSRAYSRAALAATTVRRVEEAQLVLSRVVDDSVVAEVIDLRSRFGEWRDQRQLLAIVA